MTPAALRALCARVLELDAAATPGPWREQPDHNDGEGWILLDDGRGVVQHEDRTLCEDDAALIAEYRTACPTLARALSEALEEIERYKAAAQAEVGRHAYHNACTDRCDNADGPCACGAWHKPIEFLDGSRADQRLGR